MTIRATRWRHGCSLQRSPAWARLDRFHNNQHPASLTLTLVIIAWSSAVSELHSLVSLVAHMSSWDWFVFGQEAFLAREAELGWVNWRSFEKQLLHATFLMALLPFKVQHALHRPLTENKQGKHSWRKPYHKLFGTDAGPRKGEMTSEAKAATRRRTKNEKKKKMEKWENEKMNKHEENLWQMNTIQEKLKKNEEKQWQSWKIRKNVRNEKKNSEEKRWKNSEEWRNLASGAKSSISKVCRCCCCNFFRLNHRRFQCGFRNVSLSLGNPTTNFGRSPFFLMKNFSSSPEVCRKAGV